VKQLQGVLFIPLCKYEMIPGDNARGTLHGCKNGRILFPIPYEVVQWFEYFLREYTAVFKKDINGNNIFRVTMNRGTGSNTIGGERRSAAKVHRIV